MHFHSIPNYAGSDSEQADSEQADSGFPSMFMMWWDSSLTESTRLNRTFRQ